MDKYIAWRIVLDGDVDEFECLYPSQVEEIIEQIADDLREGLTHGTVHFDPTN